MNDQPRRFLQRVWQSVRQPTPTVAARAADNLVALCDSLLSERGEVSGGRLAAEAMTAYEELSESARDAFFTSITTPPIRTRSAAPSTRIARIHTLRG